MGYGGPRCLYRFTVIQQTRTTSGDLTEKKITVDVFHFVWFWQRLSRVGRGGGTGGMNPKGGEDDDDDDRGDDDDDQEEEDDVNAKGDDDDADGKGKGSTGSKGAMVDQDGSIASL